MPAYARLRTAKRHRGPGKKKVWGPSAQDLFPTHSPQHVASKSCEPPYFRSVPSTADSKKMGLRGMGQRVLRHPVAEVNSNEKE